MTRPPFIAPPAPACANPFHHPACQIGKPSCADAHPETRVDQPMPRRARALHLANAHDVPVCPANSDETTRDPRAVTCRRCLKRLALDPKLPETMERWREEAARKNAGEAFARTPRGRALLVAQTLRTFAYCRATPLGAGRLAETAAAAADLAPHLRGRVAELAEDLAEAAARHVAEMAAIAERLAAEVRRLERPGAELVVLRGGAA